MAVEARLRERARRLGVPAYIVRRQAALERLVVRLSTVAPGRWAVKGGRTLEIISPSPLLAPKNSPKLEFDSR